MLFLVEMWERFCYYGMRAIFVLYMVQSLRFSTEKAGNIYGIYTGLVYLTPLLGGYLADRYFGQRRCVAYGSILICLGLFALSVEIHWLFYTALVLMIFGNGFFKANISTILGKLYGDDMSKRDAGYTIFYMGINLGALFSPLVCGTLAVQYGYKYGFMAAGVGMLIGLLTYKLGEKKFLGASGMPFLKGDRATEHIQDEHLSSRVGNCPPQELTQKEKTRMLALFLLMFFVISFWIAFEQAGSSLTLFAEYSANRFIPFLNFEIPTSWLQSLNPLYIIILAPLVSVLWTNLAQKGKEPSTVSKFVVGMLLISLSLFVMVCAASQASVEKVALVWLLAVYFIQTVAELCISPVGLSLVSKLAPAKFASLMMGTWFLSSFFGNLIAGFFAGQYDLIEHTKFFLILALWTLIAAIALFSLRKILTKWME